MALQGRPWETNLWLTLSGSPVTGLGPSDVTFRYRLPSATVFIVKALTVDNWVEVGLGLYVLTWDAGELPHLGEVAYRLTGPGIDPVRAVFGVDPVPPYMPSALDLCVISGNIVDIGGNPTQASAIKVRKAIGLQYVGTSFITSEPLAIAPDFNGNFTVQLVRGSTVVFAIDNASVRHQVTVPQQSTALLKDLLPPPG